jgi:hypothetical protein
MHWLRVQAKRHLLSRPLRLSLSPDPTKRKDNNMLGTNQVQVLYLLVTKTVHQNVLQLYNDATGRNVSDYWMSILLQ